MTSITVREFGKTKDGRPVKAFDLTNGRMCVTVLDFGCTIQSVTLPDKDGVIRDVVLGYDDVASYEQGTCFYGAVVGRVANRLANARFALDGKDYQLEPTNGETNHVHGIFNHRLFDAAIDGDKLVLRYVSPSMEEGYPGNLSLTVTISLSDDNSLEIDYLAETDAPTIVNLTNHTYFNLNGQDGSTIFDHRLKLNCSRFTEYNDDFSQTGKILPVDGSPLDFRTEHPLGKGFYDDFRQVRICTGYDHNMIIDGEEGALKYVGTCTNDKTGLRLTMHTTEPAIQFYSSNYVHYDPVPVGKCGIRYPKNGALCLEAQHYPDSPRHPHFPSIVLRPGETYTQKTIYKIETI